MAVSALGAGATWRNPEFLCHRPYRQHFGRLHPQQALPFLCHPLFRAVAARKTKDPRTCFCARCLCGRGVRRQSPLRYDRSARACGRGKRRVRGICLHLCAHPRRQGGARHDDGVLFCGVFHRRDPPLPDRRLSAHDGHAASLAPARGRCGNGRTVLHHGGVPPRPRQGDRRL